MNKVYLLIEDWACGYESGIDTEVFNTYEEARARFLEKKESILKDCNYNTVEESGDSVEMYDEGYYSENHTSLYIEVKEVK